MGLDRGYNVPIEDIQGRVKNHGITLEGADLGDVLPVILVDVRTTSKGLRGFARVCQQKTVFARVAGSADTATVPCVEQLTADVMEHASASFEVMGRLEDLEYLAGHPSVIRWGYAVRSVYRPRFVCAGAGPEKIRTRPAAADPKPGAWVKTHAALREAAGIEGAQACAEAVPVLLDVLAKGKDE